MNELAMTDREICTRYRDALYKRQQIEYLAQLNDCSEQTIRNILKANHYAIPTGRPSKNREQEVQAPKKAVAGSGDLKQQALWIYRQLQNAKPIDVDVVHEYNNLISPDNGVLKRKEG